MHSVYRPSTLGYLIFTLAFVTWALFELWVNLRQMPAGATNRDRLSRFIIVAGMMLAFALAVSATRLHAFDIQGRRSLVFSFGVALMFAGILFRWTAIRQLGRFFIPEVNIQPGQQVIDTGLYRYIRHPSYTGAFLTITGYGLALTNWLSLALMLLISAPLFGFRIYVEEAALLDAFGEEYQRYMARTKRLLPFLF